MAWITFNRPAAAYTASARPGGGGSGRFAFGAFGSARFGKTDSWTRVPWPGTVTRTQALAGEAFAGEAKVGLISQNYTAVPRPSQ